ncbi:Porin-like protein NicP precursor [compost metagenome]
MDYELASGASDVGEWERDLRLDYVVQSGALKGLGLAWLNASLRSDVSADIDENRLVFSYSLPLF